MRSSTASLKLSQTQSRSGFATEHECEGDRERARDRGECPLASTLDQGCEGFGP